MKLPLVLFLVFVSVSVFAQEAPLTLEREAPLTLDRAVDLAVARNERSAIAGITVEQAQARVRRARSIFLPRVDVSGNYRNDYDDGTSRSLSSQALLTQPLFDARAFPLMRQVRLERDAAVLTADDTRRLLGFDAASFFLATLSYEQLLIAAEHRRDFAQTNLNDVRARFEAGLVSSNDVTRAELELATAVRGVAQARGDVQDARIDLANLLKVDSVGPLTFPAELLAEADDPPTIDPSLITSAQQRRTDIAAARARLGALEAFADEPRARFIPTATLNANTRSFNEGPITNREGEGGVGVTFNWPLFDAGVRAAETAERNALVRAAELQLELSLRDVDRQLRSAGVQLETEQASLREAAAALRAARKNADETNELYRQGLASALELADANQRLFDAEVAEVTARYRMAVSYLALREAAGLTPTGSDR